MMAIENPYDAFCFDEACYFISFKMNEGEKPSFTKKYSSFADIYKDYE